jgi:hypothetical protein
MEDLENNLQPVDGEVMQRRLPVKLSVCPTQLDMLLELGELEEYKNLLSKLVFEGDILGATLYDMSQMFNIPIPKVKEVLKEARNENLRAMGSNMLANTVSDAIAQQQITSTMALRGANETADPMVKSMNLKIAVESQANLLKSLTPSTGLTSIIESAADNEDHKTMSKFKNDIMAAVMALSDKVEELKAQEDTIDVGVDDTQLGN